MRCEEMGLGSGDKQQVNGDTGTRTGAWRKRVKRDEEQDLWDQDMDMGNQDTDTGPLGLVEDGRNGDTGDQAVSGSGYWRPP